MTAYVVGKASPPVLASLAGVDITDVKHPEQELAGWSYIAVDDVARAREVVANAERVGIEARVVLTGAGGKCPRCSTEVWGVEIREVYDGVLFWECPNCSQRFARFSGDHPLAKRAARYLEAQ